MSFSPCRPLSQESRLRGYCEIRRLLGLTHDRENRGHSGLGDYIQFYGKATRNALSTLNDAVKEGKVKVDFDRPTIEKLANIIFVPGTDRYYGDSDEDLSLFIAISEGWLDGIPPHLRGKVGGDRSYESMSLKELEAERAKIDALIQEKSIDLDGIHAKNTVLAAFLDEQCRRQKITRTKLAEQTIGITLFAQLIGSAEPIPEDSIAPLGAFVGIPASVLLVLRDSSNVSHLSADVSH